MARRTNASFGATRALCALLILAIIPLVAAKPPQMSEEEKAERIRKMNLELYESALSRALENEAPTDHIYASLVLRAALIYGQKQDGVNPDMLCNKMDADGDVYVFGRTQGNLEAVRRIVDIVRKNVDSGAKFIFLGGYGMGNMIDIASFTAVLALKCLYPSQVFILSNNNDFGHEIHHVTYVASSNKLFEVFEEEEVADLNSMLNRDIYSSLPYYLDINGVFFSHSGMHRNRVIDIHTAKAPSRIMRRGDFEREMENEKPRFVKGVSKEDKELVESYLRRSEEMRKKHSRRHLDMQRINIYKPEQLDEWCDKNGIKSVFKAAEALNRGSFIENFDGENVCKQYSLASSVDGVYVILKQAYFESYSTDDIIVKPIFE